MLATDVFVFFLLYIGKETPWLASIDQTYESAEPVFLELHATAMLCLPSGECMCPDATVCTTLTSALYSSAGDEVVLNRQLTVCKFSLETCACSIFYPC